MRVAIDPGTAGGIVAGHLDGSFVVSPMPKTDREITDFLIGDLLAENVAYLEDLVKYAGTNMPSSAMAVYASSWGFLKGVLTTNKYRIVLVPPKKWQAALGLGRATGLSKTQWKNKLKQRAEQLFPQIKVTLATADALLIYEAAKRGLIG